MNARSQKGFTLIEVLIALTILMVAVVPVLWICAAAQRLARSQSEAGDLQQRARVFAEKIQRDLSMAGAGPPGGGLRLVVECPDGTRVSLTSDGADWDRVDALVRALVAR